MSILTQKELEELSNILNFNEEEKINLNYVDQKEINLEEYINKKIEINIKNKEGIIIDKGILLIDNNSQLYIELKKEM